MSGDTLRLYPPLAHPPLALLTSPHTGLGQVAVTAIAAEYPTPISLFKAYEAAARAAMAAGRNVDAAARGLLAGLTASDGAGGGVRMVGTQKSARVYDHLFSNGWQVQ